MLDISKEKIFDMVMQHGVWVVINPITFVYQHYDPDRIMIEGETIKVFTDDPSSPLRILTLSTYNTKWSYSHKQLDRGIKRGNKRRVV